jgi:hypothetical protein
MFWKRKVDRRPLGVPLDEVRAALRSAGLKVAREASALVAKHGGYSTRVDVVPPASRDTENGPIRAVVQVRSQLPDIATPILSRPGAASALNGLASLGAITVGKSSMFVGSRVTLYEHEDVWSIQGILVAAAAVGATEALMGGIRRSLSGEQGRGGQSAWTEADMTLVASCLSMSCACNADAAGITAEFPLDEGAAAGGSRTALWELSTKEPHPEIGGGLVCLLQLPHRVTDANRLDDVVIQMNRLEMAPDNLPPHFGAWCAGKLGNNVAYVSFLPNPLHSRSGIAVNFSLWAMHRAQWANAVLASLGVRA